MINNDHQISNNITCQEPNEQNYKENTSSKRESLNNETELEDKRKNTLETVDNVKFGSFQMKTILVAGVGFFTDAYDLFVINLVMLILGIVYCSNNNYTVPVYIDTLVKAAGEVGTLTGQILFGYLGDKYGRKRIYGIELIIIMIGTVGSSLSFNITDTFSVFVVLGIWRVFMGVGIGGDYPLSAIITSEFSNKKYRGALMAAVFAMQGFGILVAPIVAIIFLSIFKNAIKNDVNNLDYVWRLCIGFGALPCLFTLYFRLTMPETPRYTIEVENNIQKAARDVNNFGKQNNQRENSAPVLVATSEKASWADFFHYFSKWNNLKVLLATSISWFALDVAFYGVNLNSGIILDAIGFSGNLTVGNEYNSLFKNSVGNIVIALMGTLPGYWATVALIEVLGRKMIQLIGFAILTALFVVLSIGYYSIILTSIELFIFLFILIQFFHNFGPNTTTFIIPGEVFPTRYRSTAHGISAAMGKLGAIISQVGFFQLKDIGGKNAKIPLLLGIFAGFMFIGLLVTFFVPETKGKSLEEISNEHLNSFNFKQLKNDDELNDGIEQTNF